jgi:hypothetical protein
MLVVIVAEDDLVHESHVVKSFTLDFGQRALQRVHAHSIGHQMGITELIHSAALRCEALLTEIGQDIRCP